MREHAERIENTKCSKNKNDNGTQSTEMCLVFLMERTDGDCCCNVSGSCILASEQLLHAATIKRRKKRKREVHSE